MNKATALLLGIFIGVLLEYMLRRNGGYGNSEFIVGLAYGMLACYIIMSF